MPTRAHVVRRHDAAHQHVDERRGLGRRIPAVDVERGVRFGDAARLHLGQRLVELLAALELRQDEVAGRVDHAAKAFDHHRRHGFANQVEHRHAVHHHAFEEEDAIHGFRQRLELVVRERHRALVGGDDVRLAFERGAHVRRGRLAAIDVEHGGLDASPAGPPPHRRRADPRPGESRRCRCARAGAGSSRSSDWLASTVASARRVSMPADVDDAAVMPRRDADDLPGEVEAIRGFAEEPDEAPRDVAEPDQDERQLGLVHASEAAACDRAAGSDASRSRSRSRPARLYSGGSPKPRRR